MRPDGASSQQVQQELQRKYHTKAQVYEKVSLQGIQQLVYRSYQTLALWKLLCDHQFSLIMSELPKVHVCTNTSPADAHTSSLQYSSTCFPECNVFFSQKPGVQCELSIVPGALIAHSAVFFFFFLPNMFCRSFKSR